MSSPKRNRKSKKSKHSHKKRRRRSPSSSSTDSIKDYGRYQITRHPLSQDVTVHTTVQPDMVTKESLSLHFDNSVRQASNDSGSDSEQESWSFDKAINDVFILLPEEMCPRPSEDHTLSKPQWESNL